METYVDPETMELDYLHHLALQTMANAEDTPTYDQAMHGPFAKEFQKAMQLEWDTLNDDVVS